MSAITEGNYLAITVKGSEKLFLIVGIEGELLRLEDAVSGAMISENAAIVSQRLSAGEAEIVSKNTISRNLSKPKSQDFASYSEEDKFVAKYRLIFVRAVIDAGVDDFSVNSLKPILAKTANDEKLTPPSIRTLQRWIKAYIEADYSIRGLIPQTSKKGNKNKKVNSALEPFIAKGIEFYKRMEKPTISTAYNEMVDLIHEENELMLSDKLSIPSFVSFWHRIKQQAPFEVMAAQDGKKAARRLFKTKQQPPNVSTILERAEIDHTKLDLFVVDDESLLPLGRPWLTCILDYYSRSVLGFYIGFEPPSYLSVNKALKHALSAKSYLRELYPNVENEWPVYGVMNTLVCDRGKEFESKALKEACLDLGVTLQLNPVGSPWYKGVAERHFKVINNELLDNNPGKVFSSLVDKGDYDPQKNAVISFSKLVELMHIWVVDIYQRSPRSDHKLMPDLWWRKAAADTPVFSVEKDKLNIILGKPATPKLSKDGIRLNYLYYDSDQLRQYRQQMGFVKVHIKFDPDDLGEVYVFDENTKTYFVVPAVDQAYARGLSTWQHEVIKHYCRNEIKANVDREALSRAKRKIKELVAQERINVRASAKSRARLARFLKISQQTEVLEENEQKTVQFKDVTAHSEDIITDENIESITDNNLGLSNDVLEDDWPDELDI